MRSANGPLTMLGVALLGLTPCAGAKDAGADTTKPNIVVILTDDLGYGDVSFLNPESKIQTPRMDALAREGVWASDAHAPSAVCSPTRYGLLTGRYPWRHPSLKRGVLMPWDETLIESTRPTLPRMLQRAGYATACIGKWHLGFEWPWKGGEMPPQAQIRKGSESIAKVDQFDFSRPIAGGPWAAGFDHYFGEDVINFPPYAFIEDGRLTCEPVDIQPEQLRSSGTRGNIHGTGPGEKGWTFEQVLPTTTRRAVDYVRSRAGKEQPFFLYFTPGAPHTPVVPAKEFQGRSRAGLYGDFVIQTDDAIGQVVDALKESGQFDNTLLIVTSDNGPCGMQRNLIQSHDHQPAGDFRGMKAEHLEGGHRVPFFASWPAGGLAGGRRTDALINLTDLFATLAGVLGTALPEGAAPDSVDIMPALREGRPVREETVVAARSGSLGLRHGDWVYLESGGHMKEPEWYRGRFGIEPVNSSAMLFNLREDPGQKRNLALIHPEKVKALRQRLAEISR